MSLRPGPHAHGFRTFISVLGSHRYWRCTCGQAGGIGKSQAFRSDKDAKNSAERHLSTEHQ